MPKQFLQKAKEVKHALSPLQVISPLLKEAIRDVLCEDPISIAKRRLKAVIAVKQLASELEVAEEQFKLTLHPDVADALKSKRLLLWKALLKASDFDDVAIVDLIAAGLHKLCPAFMSRPPWSARP